MIQWVKGDFQRISTTIGQIAEQHVLGFYLVEAFAPSEFCWSLFGV